jgi:PPOX class probable F420-dependent enzyme
MAEPVASRPFVPGYGLRPASEGTGLLPWESARERLQNSHDYWLATARPDGRPHLMPVWGVWLDEALWFSTSVWSRKARNLRGSSWCSVSTDDALDPVVLEGTAQVRSGEPDRRRFLEVLNAKYSTGYGLDFLDGTENLCLRVEPTTVFGLLQHDFTGSPTRWSFPVGDC